jgi:hypothetical protein
MGMDLSRQSKYIGFRENFSIIIIIIKCGYVFDGSPEEMWSLHLLRKSCKILLKRV